MKKILNSLFALFFPYLLFAQEVVEQLADDLPWYYSRWLWFIIMLVCVSIILIIARNATKKKIHKSDKI